MKIFQYLRFALACGVIAFATGCSDDDGVHTPDADNSSKEIKFSGTLTSSVPAMPVFTPSASPNEAVLKWDDDSHATATVRIGAFDIDVPQAGMAFSIGDMTISGLKCVNAPDGSVTMRVDEFSCMAGDYATQGSADGDLRDGVLTLTVSYHPGSMPFEVMSVFTGNEVK